MAGQKAPGGKAAVVEKGGLEELRRMLALVKEERARIGKKRESELTTLLLSSSGFCMRTCTWSKLACTPIIAYSRR